MTGRGRRLSMKNVLRIVIVLSLFLVPNLVLADCLNIRGVTGLYVEGAHDVTLYRGMAPVAYLHVSYCNIGQDSNIRLNKPYLCDGDKLLIDGEECTLTSVSSALFPQF